jgi:hypothetical protein
MPVRDGVLGLGPRPRKRTDPNNARSFTYLLWNDGTIIKPEFSLYLSDKNSEGDSANSKITFGGVDTEILKQC